MFERLGKLVERRWQVILVLWGIALLGATAVHTGWFNRLGWLPFRVPTWMDVAKDGEFAFLPNEMKSLVGERLLATAFPEDLLKSSVVIVVGRDKRPLRTADELFIENVLKPRLEAIRDELIDDPTTLEVRTSKNPTVGPLLVSRDKEASLVIMPLKNEFLSWGNKPVVDRVENLIDKVLPNERDPATGKGVVPAGLYLAMSGSATVGRDMLVANDESGKKTELWTTILVVFLLGAIYRSPFLAFIPLATVFVSVQIAKALVILLTEVPFLNYRVFFGMEVYITVVVYGTGVDYCLFLIARYKEEIDTGLPLRQALSATLAHVGAALTASALTVICGIGMMVFAQFGKFQEAGIAISLGLTIGLLAALTLSPALLRCAGSAAFWPVGRLERIHAPAGRISGTSLINRLVRHDFFYRRWEDVGRWLLRSPGKILISCFLLMLPFAIWGLVNYEYLSYGLLSELPVSKKSVIGAKAVQEHFPAGYAGPLTILFRNDEIDFESGEGHGTFEGLISRLEHRAEELGIADIRYMQKPLGMHVDVVEERAGGSAIGKILGRDVQRKAANTYYVSNVEEHARHVTRVDVVFYKDPFDRESIQQLNAVEDALKTMLRTDPDLALLKNSEIHMVGATASIRDLKSVTDHDQIKIDLLVLAAVFVILLLLLRKPAISAYLILSVFFSYFVALGVTFVVFRWLDPQGFSGLDWKVPMFLFTILMAIGEDYNIFLMTRIEEEQRQHGLIEGVRVAMLKTGTIISSCGVIMAGTFTSLLFGTLVGLKQLGFALAFGVLLDTFVVRPLLVPAYLILLYQGRFGAWSRLLGGINPPAVPPPPHPKTKAKTSTVS